MKKILKLHTKGNKSVLPRKETKVSLNRIKTIKGHQGFSPVDIKGFPNEIKASHKRHTGF